MEVIQQQNNTGALSRTFARSGVAGNYDILYQIVRITRRSVKNDIGVKRLASNLLIDSGFDSYTPAEDQLELIYKFVKRNVKYIEDVAGLIESIKDARTTLSDGFGDCDDLTILVATLVADLGFEDIKICMARYLETDAAFVHVYPVIYADGKRFVLDATLPNGRLGDEVEPLEVREIGLFDEIPGFDGFSGVFTNTRYYAKQTAMSVTEAVPVAAGFLPMGFISSKVFAKGATLLNQSATEELSLPATASKINQELDKLILQLLRSQIALEVARSYALQASSQLSAVKVGRDNREAYEAAKQSIGIKLDFINNFEKYADAHGIKVVNLNPTLTLITGVAGLAFGAFVLYKAYKGRKITQ